MPTSGAPAQSRGSNRACTIDGMSPLPVQAQGGLTRLWCWHWGSPQSGWWWWWPSRPAGCRPLQSGPQALGLHTENRLYCCTWPTPHPGAPQNKRNWGRWDKFCRVQGEEQADTWALTSNSLLICSSWVLVPRGGGRASTQRWGSMRSSHISSCQPTLLVQTLRCREKGQLSKVTHVLRHGSKA